MGNRKMLWRKCAYCGRSLPVVNEKDYFYLTDEEHDNTVTWRTDPFNDEVHQDYTKMWLCGKCADAQADEV